MSLEDTHRYASYFRTQLETIQKLEAPLFRKILYFGLIDTLSRAGCPQQSGHHVRVTSFIKKCATWPDATRVSAQQLLLTLEDEGKISGELYALAQAKVKSWGTGGIIRPEEDLSLDEASKVAAVDETNLLMNATYLELFYTYRNLLIHEFREPGYAIEMSADPSTPYYHSMIGEPWQLGFPVAFIKVLCENCLQGLERALVAENRNPYDCYVFGSLWRRRKK